MPFEEEQQEAPASPIDGETAIRTMEVTVSVSENGKAYVTAKVEMNIVGTVKELRFSFPKGAKSPKIAGYKTSSDKENGIKYLTIKDKDGFTKGTTLELSWSMSGLVAERDQGQVLTLPILSLQDYRIGTYTFAVAMHQDVTTVPHFNSGYYNDLVEGVMTIRTQDEWIVGAMNEIIRDNDTLTMTLVVPDGYFKGNFGESKMPMVMTVIVLVILAGAMAYWFLLLRNPPLKVRARTLPPDGVNPGDLPFLLGGGDTDFNMLVSHWAVLGYLSIYISKSGHVILRRRMDMGNERRKLEQKLFALLFGDDEICDTASVRYKRVGEKAMQVVRSYWNKRLYEKDSGAPFVANALCWLACAIAAFVAMDAVAPQAGHGFFLLLSLVAGAAMGMMISRAPGFFYLSNWIMAGVGAGCALLMLIIGGAGGATLAVLPAVGITLFVGWQTCHGGKRRPYGDEVIGQAMGFRRFMMHASEHHVLQMQVRDTQYFYKLLPYAQAMGLGKKFVSLFHDCRLEPCQWYTSAREIPGTAMAFYIHYCETLELMELSIRK